MRGYIGMGKHNRILDKYRFWNFIFKTWIAALLGVIVCLLVIFNK